MINLLLNKNDVRVKNYFYIKTVIKNYKILMVGLTQLFSGLSQVRASKNLDKNKVTEILYYSK